MTIEHLIAFNLALFAAILSPGPAMVFVIQTTLANGRSTGLVTGWGLGTMAAMWTLCAMLGLNGLFLLFPWAYTAFRVFGAVYLLYVAWSTWVGAKQRIVRGKPMTRRSAFASGLLVNLANPKSVFFAAAVLVVVFPVELSLADKSIIVFNHLAVELVAYTVFACLFSTDAVSSRYLRAKPHLDRLSALLLGALGLRLLLAGSDQAR